MKRKQIWQRSRQVDHCGTMVPEFSRESNLKKRLVRLQSTLTPHQKSWKAREAVSPPTQKVYSKILVNLSLWDENHQTMVYEPTSKSQFFWFQKERRKIPFSKLQRRAFPRFSFRPYIRNIPEQYGQHRRQWFAKKSGFWSSPTFCLRTNVFRTFRRCAPAARLLVSPEAIWEPVLDVECRDEVRHLATETDDFLELNDGSECIAK